MTNLKNYIGIATTAHDPAISIVDHNGEIIFAESVERYLQDKRAWMAAPDNFMFVKNLINTYCSPNLDLVISSSWTYDYINQQKDIIANSKTFEDNFNGKKIPARTTIFQSANINHGCNIEFWYANQYPNAKIIKISNDHHLTHAAFASYTSQFSDALCVVIDAEGENGSDTCFLFKNNRLQKISTKSSSGSLGAFYAMICTICGFSSIAGEEWKVMGLAPYGKLNLKYYELLKQVIIVDDINFTSTPNSKEVLKQLFLLKRHPHQSPLEYADFAYTSQLVFSELINEYLSNLHKRQLSDNLILTGGCMLNSSYVGNVHIQTQFKNCYVPSAPADDGNAAGAALLAFYKDNPDHKRVMKIQTPYLGSEFDNQRLNLLGKYSGLSQMSFDNDESLCKYVAKQISEGKIIGWAQGRAEYGPRALGNRSILADPRSNTIKDYINENVKFREEFRPFAPSILAEFGDQYFENYVDTPYMERTLKFREEVKDKIPGVVHVDGSGRLQSVHSELNPKYAMLIKSFYDITKIPILLDTSFNVMGKPIIHSVENAIAVFLTSGIDLLVINNEVFSKS